MNQLNKLSLAGMLMLFFLFIGTSCTSFDEQTNAETNKPDIDAVTDDQPPPADINLPVYFVEFGEDDAWLVREVHTIPYTKQVASAAMQELINDPRSIFPAGAEILGVSIENGLVTVDFSSEVLNNHSIGALGEELGIQSIVNTLAELPTVEKVVFQVKGSSEGLAQDWWGHVGLYEQPFTYSCSRVFKPAIWVTHPSENQVVGVPLFIKGSAMVEEGIVYAQVLDKYGNVLAESSTTTTSNSDRGSFEMSIKLEPPLGDNEGDPEEGLVRVSGYTDPETMQDVEIPVFWP